MGTLRITKNDDLMIKISTGQSVAKRHACALASPKKKYHNGGIC